MNVERLRKVRAVVLAEPELFDMDQFVKPAEHTCGTACCIGGWAATLAGFIPKTVKHSVDDDWRLTAKGRKAVLGLDACGDHNAHWLAAMAALGLTDFSEAERLMLAHRWPEPFRAQFQDATTDKQRARIAAKRITRFIKTGGLE